MSKLGEQLAELDDAIESHPYHEISNRLEEIRIILDVLEGNYEVLSYLIDEWLQDKEYFFNSPLSERMKVQKELYRRLHNYLASYYTQYEFTKTLRDETIGRDSDEYRRLIELHNIRPTSDFLKTLRNFMQHETLLDLITSYSWERAERDTSIRTFLSVDKLKKLKDSYPNKKAKEFIESYDGDEIVLTEVIESHHTDLMAFQHDFRDLIQDEYEGELAEYLRLQSERTEIEKEIFGTE